MVARLLIESPAVSLSGLVKSTRVQGLRQGRLRGALGLLRRCGPQYLIYLGAVTAVSDLLGPRFGLLSVDRAAALRGIPLLATRNVNDPSGVEFVAGRQPDILVSAFFNQWLGESVCAVPRLSAVNIHPSLLPDYRGVDPVFHARLRGAAQLGVSLHRISPEFDSGPLIAQTKLAVDSRDSVMLTTARLFECGTCLLLDRLQAVADNHAGVPQGDGGRYDSWPSPDQVNELLASGSRLWRLGDFRAVAADLL
ncbi:MAG: formyltransferase family protein [Woeseiaceae bacterium]|nr:formyltransferase family protein [Woeseiaceae bacterium]